MEVQNTLADAPVPALVGRTAYRIVQEGLTNARKHAPGAAVQLRLDGAPGGQLHVELRNRLTAAAATPPIPGSRSGLVGLAERVDLLGGRLISGARRGGGGAEFQLEAWLPWPG